MQGFGGLEGVLKGKTELYKYLTQNPNSKIFINADDPLLMKQTMGLNYIAYGTSKDLPIYGRLVHSDSEFLVIQIFEGDSNSIIRTQLTGEYNLYNVLLAYTIGRYFEVDSKKIIQALENYQPSNSRSQVLKKEQLTIILDAYNANPSSMEVALHNLAKFSGKKTAILGAMKELGEFTAVEHKKIVDLALSLNLDTIVVVGSEFGDIISDERIFYFENTDNAKKWFQNQKFSKQTILIKGSRGMALEKLLD